MSRLPVRHVSHGAAVQHIDVGRSVGGDTHIPGGDELPSEQKRVGLVELTAVSLDCEG